MGGVFNFDTYENPCELPWVLTMRWILGALQVVVNMFVTIIFANERDMQCLEGLIVQPVFQAFLGFLVMATAVVGSPVYFVVISCVLNIIMCFVNWFFYYLYKRSATVWKEKLQNRFYYGTIVMSIISGLSAFLGLALQTYGHSDNCGIDSVNHS